MKFPNNLFRNTLIGILLIIMGLMVIDDSTAQFTSFDKGNLVIAEPISGEEIIPPKTALIDITIYSIQCGDFEVILKPNSEIPINTITNIQFTLKWPANTVTLIDFYSDYNVELQGSVVIENDTNYAIFVSAVPVPISWLSGIEYPVLSFSHDQSGIGFLDLLIDTGDWAKMNNGEYYVELLGIDETGIVSQNAMNILLEKCGRLDLKVFLQGPYNSSNGLMTTTINDAGDLPMDQPYFNPPWNYSGIENVGLMPGNVVDWVLVELRDANDAASASSATMVYRLAALLIDDGSIVALDGISPLTFNNALIQNLFVVLEHRNHLGILSSMSVVESPSDTYAYDFTIGASQAFGSGQASIGNGSYGLIGGDANSNGIIDNADMIQVWDLTTGYSGYYKGDMNLDGQVENRDKNDFWFIHLDIETQVPD